jgi:hypothetical protein
MSRPLFRTRMRLRRIKQRLALYLLGLPQDTKGVCLPGTIRIPPGSGPVDIQGFYFILTGDAPGIKIDSTGSRIDFMGGA